MHNKYKLQKEINKIMPVERTHDYITVNQKIITDKRLSLEALGLLLTIMSLPNGFDMSVETLCNLLPDSKTVIVAALNELQQLHYLKIDESKDEWIVYEEPF